MFSVFHHEHWERLGGQLVWIKELDFYVGDMSMVDFPNDWRFKDIEGKRIVKFLGCVNDLNFPVEYPLILKNGVIINAEDYFRRSQQNQTDQLSNIYSQFQRLDKRGVRAFVRYAHSNGGFTIECYRKKTRDESGEQDWKMIREGHVSSYATREEASFKALELAEEIATRFGY